MGASMTLVHAENPPGSEHAWQRAVIGADAYYGLVLTATIGVAVATSGGGDRVLAVSALAAMAPWYLVVGRPTARGVPVSARTRWYVLGIIVLLGVAQAASGWSSLALFALCPMCFVLLPAWPATGAVAAFNLVPVLKLGGDPGAALRAAGIAVGVVTFAATFGRWIVRIVEQSAERAELVDALSRARDELTRAEHQAGVLAERQRLAAEIHDTLAQGLTSILMLLQAADAAAGAEQSSAYLSQAARTARENLAEARGLITDQQPAALAGSPLHEALRPAAPCGLPRRRGSRRLRGDRRHPLAALGDRGGHAPLRAGRPGERAQSTPAAERGAAPRLPAGGHQALRVRRWRGLRARAGQRAPA